MLDTLRTLELGANLLRLVRDVKLRYLELTHAIHIILGRGRGRARGEGVKWGERQR